jgi:hypothetical protein
MRSPWVAYEVIGKCALGVRFGALVHAAWLDRGAALQAFQTGNLFTLFGYKLLQRRDLREQFGQQRLKRRDGSGRKGRAVAAHHAESLWRRSGAKNKWAVAHLLPCYYSSR